MARPCLSDVSDGASEMRDSPLPDARSCKGLREVADRYDGFVIDQWGVLHDGVAAYPGAIECLQRLRALDKTVIILSNSGKRAAANIVRLAAMGFGSASYTEFLTSGEVARNKLIERADPFYRRLGERCLLLSNDGDRSIVEGVDVELVDSVEAADFILLAGIDGSKPLATYEAMLECGIDRGLLLLCANPDLLRISGQDLAHSSGALAHRYELLGGHIHYVGKPYPEVYTECRNLFARRDATRVLAIGDSLQHDIVGGAEAGFDTMLVMTGIHRPDFAAAEDDAAIRQRLLALTSERGELPDWVLVSLRW
jgi:HAD superfamily hydrolase (TIGR01459 family)